jgi:hypothetical protein
MKTLIEGFRIFPGDHCGSVAMRGLLHHYCGLDLPEPAVFGLGAGAASIYMSGPGLDPPAVLFGRTLSMEQDLAENLEIDYREQPELDDDEAWRIVREEVRAGRPTMLSGDIFYLDYRDFKVHFPAHRFILLGFDDEAERAFIGDRIRPEPEVCSLGAVRLSRNPPEGLSTQNLWGRFQDTAIGRPLRDAAERAIARCARSMLGRPEPAGGSAEATAGLRTSQARVVEGVEGIRAFATDLPGLRERDDARWIASFNASCIEKFGNGGGNFRRLYAGFLTWARALDARLVPEPAPQLATHAADAWTATSNALFEASQEGSRPAAWDEAASHAQRAADLEERLFGMLADGTG